MKTDCGPQGRDDRARTANNTKNVKWWLKNDKAVNQAHRLNDDATAKVRKKKNYFIKFFFGFNAVYSMDIKRVTLFKRSIFSESGQHQNAKRKQVYFCRKDTQN